MASAPDFRCLGSRSQPGWNLARLAAGKALELRGWESVSLRLLLDVLEFGGVCLSACRISPQQCTVSGHRQDSPLAPAGTSIISVTLHTDVGDIKIEVFCERTPKACENFLALCASNYYTGCIFHRNIKGFMVQTGDPTGTGRGGNSIWGRKFEDEYSEYLKHSVRGVVSMANNGPNTNGSQFFITYGKQPHLDMKYTVFGKVIDGLETLDELEKLPVNEKTYRPLNDVHIKDITIHANPFAQ
ncbi:peptidyl-prolyl cis-trans isomerase-like 3 [Suncus etruscus]|uniref:peptidyl-prolyl cis-trans isomerase-like 3 n=1 Tax=Suncus etruscus TaxID=109475 RepID=UPI00210F71EF|nr:peptidyl-prolyl cis-trans isomerase-like 3 [Suncus etruscus]